MAEFNDKIIEMGCDFWIGYRRRCSLGRNPYDQYTNPRGPQQKAKYSEQDHTKKYPKVLFKQNLWELSGTVYFEKDDHLIPFKSIDMLEMIEKQKSSFQKIFRNYKYKCLLHFCYVNRHKLQFRIPPELWRRIAPLRIVGRLHDLYLFSNSKKIK